MAGVSGYVCSQPRGNLLGRPGGASSRGHDPRAAAAPAREPTRFGPRAPPRLAHPRRRARYARRPPWRRTSRLIVEGARPAAAPRRAATSPPPARAKSLRARALLKTRAARRRAGGCRIPPRPPKDVGDGRHALTPNARAMRHDRCAARAIAAHTSARRIADNLVSLHDRILPSRCADPLSTPGVRRFGSSVHGAGFNELSTAHAARRTAAHRTAAREPKQPNARSLRTCRT